MKCNICWREVDHTVSCKVVDKNWAGWSVSKQVDVCEDDFKRLFHIKG